MSRKQGTPCTKIIIVISVIIYLLIISGNRNFTFFIGKTSPCKEGLVFREKISGVRKWTIIYIGLVISVLDKGIEG
jgi:hypothetical protein